jgi:hypothetical protein
MSDEKKVNRNEEVEKLAKEIGELDGSAEIERMIKNNVIEFSIEDTKYRVRTPNYEEQKEMEKFRRRKYLELVQDETIKFQKEWISIYKNKDIDIEQMEQDIIKLKREEEQKLLKLAETADEKKVNNLKIEIIEIRKKIAEIQVEKTDLLSYSLEDLLQLEISSFMVYVTLEKQESDKWVKNYATYDDCAKDSGTLFNRAFYYASYLQVKTIMGN